MDAQLVEEIRRLVLDLVAGRYAQIASDGRIGRLTEAELNTAVASYGRRLVPLPDEAWRLVDVFHQAGATESISLDVPLWTEEEGRSDLTLSLSARRRGDHYEIEIDDLHVL